MILQTMLDIEKMPPKQKEEIALFLAVALWEIGPFALAQKLTELLSQQAQQRAV